MKKIAFLSCDDLSDYVVDDDHVYNLLGQYSSKITFDVVSWSDPNVLWDEYDYVIIRTTWDYTKRIKEFLEFMDKIQESSCTVLNSVSIVKWNSNKTYLKELRKGAKIIESYFLDEVPLEALSLKLNENKKYVLKPIFGASADNIQVLNKTELLQAINQLQDFKMWFVQPFVDEVLNGEISLIYFNNQLSHAVKKTPAKGDFRVQEEHGGIITLHTPSQTEVLFADAVLKSIDSGLLYARVDLINTSEGPKLIELELIEPSLYFRIDPQSPQRFVDALLKL